MKTIKMKRADAEKWLAALRSGEYKQGRDYLCRSHNQNTFAGMAQVTISAFPTSKRIT